MASKPKTINDFMAANDRDTIIRNRIKAELKAMAAVSPEQHADEREFCASSAVSTADIGEFRKEFAKHLAYVPKLADRKRGRFVWFANPKAIPEKFRYNPES